MTNCSFIEFLEKHKIWEQGNKDSQNRDEQCYLVFFLIYNIIYI